jgi:hypothetical protein
MCAYQDGKQVGGCKDIPKTVANLKDDYKRNLALVNWILSQIMGSSRRPSEEVASNEIEMLQSGEYQTADGRVTHFSLPESLDLEILSGEGGIAAV